MSLMNKLKTNEQSLLRQKGKDAIKLPPLAK